MTDEARDPSADQPTPDAGTAPAGREDAPDTGEEAVSQPVEAPAAKAGLLVLVAEDDRTFRFFLRRILAPFGVELVEADNGNDALSIIHERRPHLVVCDINMPGPNGIALAENIRDNPELQKTSLVFVSSSSSHDDVLRLRELGILDYMVKPIPPGEARARFDRILQRVRQDLKK